MSAAIETNLVKKPATFPANEPENGLAQQPPNTPQDTSEQRIAYLFKALLGQEGFQDKTRASNRQRINGLEQKIASLEGQIAGSDNKHIIETLEILIKGSRNDIAALSPVADDPAESSLAGRVQQEAPTNTERIENAAQGQLDEISNEAQELADSDLEKAWSTDSFEIDTLCPKDGEGIHVKMVRKKSDNNEHPWIPIGYFDGSSWPWRRWAYAPQKSGRVPVRDGDNLCSWFVKNWLKDHLAGYPGPITGKRYFNTNSGEQERYTHSNDKMGIDYIMIPLNSQCGHSGYVPARQVKKSLSEGYITHNTDFKLIADKNERFYIACTKIPYALHGFSEKTIQYGQEVKIWWSIKNKPFNDKDEQIQKKVSIIINDVRAHHKLPELKFKAGRLVG